MKWVILRGLGREKRHWHDFLPKLEAVSENVLCLDLPGAGDNLHAPSPLKISEYTDFLRPIFLQKSEVSADWGLLGVSLGGMIALDWAYRFPKDFQRLTLINVSSSDSGHLFQRLTLYALYRIMRAGLSGDPIARETEIMKMVSNHHTYDTGLIKYFAEIRKANGVSAKNLSRQLFAASRFTLPGQIQIPTLVLASLKDNMVDVRCSKLIASHLGATLKVHPTGGHELCLDDPDWCIKQILEFQTT